MTARRRSPKHRPLTEFAQHSPLHSLAVWVLRTTVLLAVAGATYLFVMNMALQDLIDGFAETIQSQSR